MKTRQKIGLALGSGGIRGLAHIGVIKTLLKHGIPIDYIAGSSIGAWVGAHYALFQDIEQLEHLTVENRKEKLDALFEPSLQGGLIAGEKTKRLLTRWLGNAVFEQTAIPLAIVATDVDTWETHTFMRGTMVPAVQASMAIPGMFKPVTYQGHAFVDGGVSNPVPNDVVKHMGADIVIGVNLYQKPSLPKKTIAKRGLLDVTTSSIEIMRYTLSKHSMHDADIGINPPVESYANWAKYFLEDHGPEIVAIGAAETEKMIPRIKKRLR